MICGYQNINDYCTNKFSYQYATVPTVPSGDFTTSVIRTDKDSGEVITIGPDTDLYVLPCDSNDLVEVISVWECYQIFVNNSNVKVQDVDPDKIIDANSSNISKDYDLSLSDGIPINIQNMNTILLDGSINNQIHLGNIGALSIILYNIDPQSPMPYILDVNNIAYYLSYNDLQYLLTEYFAKASQQKNIKDDALTVLDSSVSVANNTFCKNKVPSNVQKSNITIDYSTVKNIISLPSNICDPPCDPNGCLSCVNGNCESFCGENQYCCDGVCQDETCNGCEGDEECQAGSLCCNGNCVEAIESCRTGCIEITVEEYMSDECPPGMGPLAGTPDPPVLTKCSGASTECRDNPDTPFLGLYGVLVTESCTSSPCEDCPVVCCLVCPPDS